VRIEKLRAEKPTQPVNGKAAPEGEPKVAGR